MSLPSCAVIIATRNRTEWLDRTIAGVDCPEVDRIILVDQSDEEFREGNKKALLNIERSFYVDSPLDGLPAARNRGFALASEEVVLFFDDDVSIFDGCIAAHLECYSDATVGAVVGRIIETSVNFNRSNVGNGINKLGLLRTNLGGDQPS